MTARALVPTPEDLRTLCNFSVMLHHDRAAAPVVCNESGLPQFPSERLTILAQGEVAILDNFAKLTVFGPDTDKQGSGLDSSMGHAEELDQFVLALEGQPNHLLSGAASSLATTSVFAADGC